MKSLFLCPARLRRIPALLFSLAFVSWPIEFLSAAPGLRSEITSEADLPGALVNRVVLEQGDAKLVVLDRRDLREGEQTRYTAAGCSTSFLVAGPVDPGGLLREAANPLGYGPASDVFDEKAGLSLYTGKEEYRRFGGLLSVPGEVFGIGAYGREDEGPHLFALFNIGGAGGGAGGSGAGGSGGASGKAPLLSGFFLVSGAASEDVPDDWFLSRQPAEGGPLCHTGARANFVLGPGDPVETRVGVTGVASGGRRSLTGAFTHLLAAHRRPWIDLRLLGGFCGEHYRTPDGGFPSAAARGSGAAALFPDGPFTCDAAYSETGLRQESPFDEELPGRRALDLGLGYKTRTFSAEAEKSWRWDLSSSGEEECRETSGFSLRLKRGAFSACANWTLTEEDFSSVRTFVLEAGYSPKTWEIEMRYKESWAEEPEVSGRIALAIKKTGMRAGVAAEIVQPVILTDKEIFQARLYPFRYVAFSVFFSAAQTSAQSPIKRTSGSRK